MNARVLLAAVAAVLAAHGASAAEDHAQHDRAQHDHSQHDHSQHDQSQHRHEPAQVDEHAHHQRSGNEGPTESERAHIPPDPPQHVMADMSNERMIELMQMEDDAKLAMVILDQLEQRDSDEQTWELDAWYGDDYNKLWFETEGDRLDGEEHGRVELMWDRIISPWWSLQTGVRQDFGPGPSRTWLDFGLQGVAPQFLEIDAALYVGEQGRTALRFSAEYDVLLTQRLILQPELELNAFGKSDPENGLGKGVADVQVGARLRYEIWREFAPYAGVHWERKLGDTADLARAAGEDSSELVFLAGFRAWF